MEQKLEVLFEILPITEQYNEYVLKICEAAQNENKQGLENIISGLNAYDEPASGIGKLRYFLTHPDLEANCVLPEYNLAEMGKVNAVEFLRTYGANDLMIACGYANGNHFEALNEHLSGAMLIVKDIVYNVIRFSSLATHCTTPENASIMVAKIPNREVREALATQAAFYLVGQPAYKDGSVAKLSDKMILNAEKINETVKKLSDYAQNHNHKEKTIKDFVESFKTVENIGEAISQIEAEITKSDGIAKNTKWYGSFFYSFGHFGNCSTTHGILKELKADLEAVLQGPDPEPSTVSRFICCT